MTTLQRTTVIASIFVSLGFGLYEAHHASTLESELQVLQAQNASLVAQTQQLDSKRASPERPAERAEPRNNTSDDPELLRLRGEVGILRRQLAGLTAQAHTTTNQIQFTAPYLPRGAWSDQGTDTPDNTIQTMFWAIGQGDQNRLEQIVFPKDSQSLDRLTFSKPDWDRIAAVQFLNVGRIHLPNGEDHANVNTLVERLEGGTKDVSIQRWVLTKINEQWIITGWY